MLRGGQKPATRKNPPNPDRKKRCGRFQMGLRVQKSTFSVLGGFVRAGSVEKLDPSVSEPARKCRDNNRSVQPATRVTRTRPIRSCKWTKMGLYMRTGGFDRSGVLGPNPPEPARCPPLIMLSPSDA
ncbi:hypothetical protein MTR_7g025040 [Medicago truncatula]|uniref:Uncharacterized protein n=1 Tax=Medicago truncatula TaxID=3880 RepID=G7KXX4_MEDTR|nr:hypothetical protein MTR_7g025040 [Medicago truncatula]